MAPAGGHGGDDMVSRSGSREPERSTGGEDHDRGLPAPPSQPQDAGRSIAPVRPGNQKKRRTAHQIERMEAVFKEYSHPDHRQRTKLSKELGLKPRQVKFWFQNRRTNIKAQKGREDSTALREDNERLRRENQQLQATVRNLSCRSCSDATWQRDAPPEVQRLHAENARLREQSERLARVTAMLAIRRSPALDLNVAPNARRFAEPTPRAMQNGVHALHVPVDTSTRVLGTEMAMTTPDAGRQIRLPGEVALTEECQAMALEIGMTAVEQLHQMCRSEGPLWVRGSAGVGDHPKFEVMDLEEFARAFPWPVDHELWQQQHWNGELMRMEASRDSAIVAMNSMDLVDAFLDADKWADLFPSMVSRGKIVQVIVDDRCVLEAGALHLMYAELRGPSPVLAVRRAYILRYCQPNAGDGTWSIVDFPVDGVESGRVQPSFQAYRRRRLSGCRIEDMPNGYSKVSTCKFFI